MLLALPPIAFLLLSHAAQVAARSHHTYGPGSNLLKQNLGLTGLEAGNFLLLLISAFVFVIPLGFLCVVPILNEYVRKNKFRDRHSLAKYPVVGAASAFSASCAVKTVVVSQSHKITLKSPLNVPIASAVATFLRQLSFTILFITIAAVICWRLKELSSNERKPKDSTSDVQSWTDHSSPIRMTASFLLFLMFASSLAQVIITASTPSTTAKVNASDALSHIFLAIYIIITLAFCATYFNIRFTERHHRTMRNNDGYKIVCRGLIPLLIVRGIYEIAREVVFVKARTQHGINLITFDFVDNLLTLLTYGILVGLTFLAFSDEYTNKNED